jgi:hypothetical protein
LSTVASAGVSAVLLQYLKNPGGPGYMVKG